MPRSDRKLTSKALRVLVSVATSTALIFVAYALTITGSTGQNASSNVILINDGDSLSTTFGSSDHKTFMSYALSALTPVPRSVNVAINGETLATMVSDFSAQLVFSMTQSIGLLFIFLLEQMIFGWAPPRRRYIACCRLM